MCFTTIKKFQSLIETFHILKHEAREMAPSEKYLQYKLEIEDLKLEFKLQNPP